MFEESIGLKLVAKVDDFLSGTRQANTALGQFGNAIKTNALDPLEDFIARQHRLEQALGATGGAISWFATRANLMFGAATLAGTAAARSAFNYQQAMDSVGTMAMRTGRKIEDLNNIMQRQATGLATKPMIAEAMQGLMQTDLTTRDMENVIKIAKNAATLKPWIPLEEQFRQITQGIRQMNGNLIDNFVEIGRMDNVYSKYAMSINKSAEALTIQEKQQAIVNAMMRTGSAIMSEHDRRMEDGTMAAQMWQNNLKELWRSIGTEGIPIYKTFNNIILEVTQGLVNASNRGKDLHQRILGPAKDTKKPGSGVGALLKNVIDVFAAPAFTFMPEMSYITAYGEAIAGLMINAVWAGMKVVKAAAFIGFVKQAIPFFKGVFSGLGEAATIVARGGDIKDGLKLAYAQVGKTMQEAWKEESEAFTSTGMFAKKFASFRQRAVMDVAKEKGYFDATMYRTTFNKIFSESIQEGMKPGDVAAAAQYAQKAAITTTREAMNKGYTSAIASDKDLKIVNIGKQLMDYTKLSGVTKGFGEIFKSVGEVGHEVFKRPLSESSHFLTSISHLRESFKHLSTAYSEFITKTPGGISHVAKSWLELLIAQKSISTGFSAISNAIGGFAKAGIKGAIGYLALVGLQELLRSYEEYSAQMTRVEEKQKKQKEAGAELNKLSASIRQYKAVEIIDTASLTKANKLLKESYDMIQKIGEFNEKDMDPFQRRHFEQQRDIIQDEHLTKDWRQIGGGGNAARRVDAGDIWKTMGGGGGAGLFAARDLAGIEKEAGIQAIFAEARNKQRAWGARITDLNILLQDQAVKAGLIAKGVNYLTKANSQQLLGKLGGRDYELARSRIQEGQILSEQSQRQESLVRQTPEARQFAEFTDLATKLKTVTTEQEQYAKAVAQTRDALQTAKVKSIELSAKLQGLVAPQPQHFTQMASLQQLITNFREIMSENGGKLNPANAQSIMSIIEQIGGHAGTAAGYLLGGGHAKELSAGKSQAEAVLKEENQRKLFEQQTQQQTALIKQFQLGGQINKMLTDKSVLANIGHVAATTGGETKFQEQLIGITTDLQALEAAAKTAGGFQGPSGEILKSLMVSLRDQKSDIENKLKAGATTDQVQQAASRIYKSESEVSKFAEIARKLDTLRPEERNKAIEQLPGNISTDIKMALRDVLISKQLMDTEDRWTTRDRSASKSMWDKMPWAESDNEWKRFAATDVDKMNATAKARSGGDLVSLNETAKEQLIALNQIAINTKTAGVQDAAGSVINSGVNLIRQAYAKATGTSEETNRQIALETEQRSLRNVHEAASRQQGIKTYQTGGSIYETSRLTDDQMIRVTGGEFVINKSAMSMPGARDVAHALNRGATPALITPAIGKWAGFQGGGEVNLPTLLSSDDLKDQRARDVFINEINSYVASKIMGKITSGSGVLSGRLGMTGGFEDTLDVILNSIYNSDAADTKWGLQDQLFGGKKLRPTESGDLTGIISGLIGAAGISGMGRLLGGTSKLLSLIGGTKSITAAGAAGAPFALANMRHGALSRGTKGRTGGILEALKYDKNASVASGLQGIIVETMLDLQSKYSNTNKPGDSLINDSDLIEISTNIMRSAADQGLNEDPDRFMSNYTKGKDQWKRDWDAIIRNFIGRYIEQKLNDKNTEIRGKTDDTDLKSPLRSEEAIRKTAGVGQLRGIFDRIDRAKGGGLIPGMMLEGEVQNIIGAAADTLYQQYEAATGLQGNVDMSSAMSSQIREFYKQMLMLRLADSAEYRNTPEQYFEKSLETFTDVINGKTPAQVLKDMTDQMKEKVSGVGSVGGENRRGSRVVGGADKPTIDKWGVPEGFKGFASVDDQAEFEELLDRSFSMTPYSFTPTEKETAELTRNVERMMSLMANVPADYAPINESFMRKVDINKYRELMNKLSESGLSFAGNATLLPSGMVNGQDSWVIKIGAGGKPYSGVDLQPGYAMGGGVGSNGVVSRDTAAILHAGEGVFNKKDFTMLQRMGFTPFESGTVSLDPNDFLSKMNRQMDAAISVIQGNATITNAIESLMTKFDTVLDKIGMGVESKKLEGVTVQYATAEDLFGPKGTTTASGIERSAPQTDAIMAALDERMQAVINKLDTMNESRPELENIVNRMLDKITNLKISPDDLRVVLSPTPLQLELSGSISPSGQILTSANMPSMLEMEALRTD